MMQRQRNRKRRLVEVVGDVAYLTLSNGDRVIIDADLADWAAQFSWGSSGSQHYAQTRLPAGERWRTYKLHRMILGVVAPKTDVDHVNGDVFDNRRANLRMCTRTENQHNRRKQRGAKQHFIGVSPTKCGHWQANIRHKGVLYTLGTFEDELTAAHARDLAVINSRGEFALLNFPDK